MRLHHRLFGFERRWAEALFEAILGLDERGAASHGLTPFGAIDRGAFWRALETAPAPSFRLGLRGFVYTLTLAPLLDRRFRRPFVRLDAGARARAVEAFDRDPRYGVRQALAALKMLACFAYFDAPAVRARFEGAAPLATAATPPGVAP